MDSDSFYQLAHIFHLIPLGLFAWMETMAAPLLISEGDLDAKTFTFMRIPLGDQTP
jgi:hypothetical protein